MSPELRIVNGLGAALALGTLGFAAWYGLRARRNQTPLEPWFVPRVLSTCGLVLVLATNLLPSAAPD